MKKIFLLTITLFFLFYCNIAATTNKFNINYYQKLLTTLKSKKKIGVETQLQISLIYRILTVLNNKTTNFQFHLENIKKDFQYINKFLELVSIYSNYLECKNNLSKKEKRIKLLETQLSNIDNKSSVFLTTKLQYDFYSITSAILQKRIDYINQNFSIWIQTFIDKIDNIKFYTKTIESDIENLQKQLKKNNILIEKFQIEKERLQLLNRDNEIKNISNAINRINEKNLKITKLIIKKYLYKFFEDLKNKDKNIFSYKNNIENILQIYNYPIYYKNAFTYCIEKSLKIKFGTKEILLHDTKKTFKDTFFYMLSLLRKPLFKINNEGISCIDIFIGIIIFILGIYIGLLYKKYIQKLTYKGINLTQSTRTLISNLGYYFILLTGFFISLKAIGIDLSSLTVIVGALSVGIGFGLQSVISNFICGLIMLFEKSIKVGDIIELDSNLIGKVVSINMRATIVNTFDNIEIIVPNQTLFQNNVINWTFSNNLRRLKIPFGVAYGTDIEKLEGIILSEIYASDIDFIRKADDKKPQIIMKEMADSSVNFELLVWISIETSKPPQIIISNFSKLIYKILYKHNIEIPFPQLDIHVKQ